MSNYVDLVSVEVRCLIIEQSDQKRLQQWYCAGEVQHEFCIHGLPYRKWCDDCEEWIEANTL